MIGDLDQLGRVVGGLIVVLTTIALVARVARRAGGENGSSGLRIVERIGLSREANLAVIEISDRKLLLGVTAQGVTMLADFVDGDDAARAAAENQVAAHRATDRRSRRDSTGKGGAAGSLADAVMTSLRRQLGLRGNTRDSDEAPAGRNGWGARRAAKHGRRAKGFGVTVPTGIPNSEPSFVPGFVSSPVSAPENIDAEELRESESAAQELAAAFGAPATDVTPLPSLADAAYVEDEPATQPQTSSAPVDALLIDVRDSIEPDFYPEEQFTSAPTDEQDYQEAVFEEPAIVLLDSDRPARRSGRRAAGPPRDLAPRTRAENRASLRETPAEDEPVPLPDDLNADEFPDLASALRAAGRSVAEPEPAPRTAPLPSAQVTGRRASRSSFVPDSPAALIQQAVESLPERTARQVAAFQAETYPDRPGRGRRAAPAQPGQVDSATQPTRANRPNRPARAQAQGQGHGQGQSQGRPPADVPAQPSGRRSQQLDPQVNGSVLSPRTWRQGVDALRDLTVRRG